MGGFRLDVLAEYWPLFVEGAEITIELTIGCVFFGIILGMILGMARMASARRDHLGELFPRHSPFRSDFLDVFCRFTDLYSSGRRPHH